MSVPRAAGTGGDARCSAGGLGAVDAGGVKFPLLSVNAA